MASIHEQAQQLREDAGRTNWDKVSALTERWLSHCRSAGHVPASEGGEATMNRNLAATYVECCAAGCGWKEKVE